MLLQTILTSSAISAVIAAIVALRSAERRITIENVTQERAKWREKVRSSAAEVSAALFARDAAALVKAKLALSLLLNPLDENDRAIIKVISGDRFGPAQAEEFHIHVSLLLKHDWERAKKEARNWIWVPKANRLSYQRYMATLGAVSAHARESAPDAPSAKDLT